MEAPTLHFRGATDEDYNFISDGVWDVYRVEKHDLSQFSEAEEEEKIRNAINEKRIVVVEENDSNYLLIAYLIMRRKTRLHPVRFS
jgi:hypothetical protein